MPSCRVFAPIRTGLVPAEVAAVAGAHRRFRAAVSHGRDELSWTVSFLLLLLELFVSDIVRQ